MSLEGDSALSVAVPGAVVTTAGQSFTTAADGAYSFTLPAGTYTVGVTKAGFAPNAVVRMVGANAVSWGSVGLSGVGALDSQAPQLAISFPSDQAPLDLAVLDLRGTVSDNSGAVASVWLSIDGAAEIPVPVTAGAFSIGLKLKPGTNTLKVSATDAAGNLTSATHTARFNAGVSGFIHLASDEAQRVAGALVQLREVGTGKVISTATTDATGAFALEGSTVRADHLQDVKANGFLTYAETLTLPDDQRLITTIGIQPGVDQRPTDVRVTFNEPLAGSTLAAERVIVYGTVTGFEVAGVKINGVPAVARRQRVQRRPSAGGRRKHLRSDRHRPDGRERARQAVVAAGQAGGGAGVRFGRWTSAGDPGAAGLAAPATAFARSRLAVAVDRSISGEGVDHHRHVTAVSNALVAWGERASIGPMLTELLDDRAVVIQLHGLLTEIDPVRWRDDDAVPLTERLNVLQRTLAQRARLVELASAMQTNLGALDQPQLEPRASWLAFKQKLMPAYESVASALRAEKIHVPSLRPTNWARSVFHLVAAAIAVAAIELLGSPALIFGIAAAYAGTFWGLELARRLDGRINRALVRFFKPVAHLHETTRVNSSTWYATGLLLLSLTQSALLCATAVAILGVADPLAALVGRRFGRIKLVHGRSLEGTLTFFVSGVLASLGVLVLFHQSVGLGPALAIAVVASGAGALAELFSLRVDDNLSVPLSAAAGAALVLALI